MNNVPSSGRNGAASRFSRVAIWSSIPITIVSIIACRPPASTLKLRVTIQLAAVSAAINPQVVTTVPLIGMMPM